MSRPAKIPQSDPFEPPLDGTVGGALDAGNERDPEDVNNNEPQGGNAVVPKPNADLNKKIAAAIEKIKTLRADRASINAEIAAVIANVEEMGVNRHAFRHALRYSDMSPEQRQGLDLSYALVRSAIQLPLQTDWIEGPSGSTH